MDLQACATAPRPDYSNFFAHHPRSILIVPPFNKTTAVEAPIVFDTTVSFPFAERGYYVFPVFLTRAILTEAGLTDEGLLTNVPPQRFKEIFGADAVLYVTINSWTTQYIVISSTVTVEVQYTLVDSESGAVLWERTEQAKHNSGSSGGGGGGLAALIVTAVDAAVTAAVVDYRPLARQTNALVVNRENTGLPAGPYHPDYKNDYQNYRE